MIRAVITGLGPVTACGIGTPAFLQGLRAGTSPIRKAESFDTSPFHAHSAAEIPDFHPEYWFAPHRLKRLDRFAQFAVASAKLAIEDSGLDWAAMDPTRIGVSFGTALGGICDAAKEQDHFRLGGPKAVHQTLALQVFGGSAHSNIAIEFGFQGVGTTNSNSCASGTVAIGDAMRYLREGSVDAVLAGGAESPLSPLTFGAFDFIKTMSRSEPPDCCRPFDAKRDGFVMGEGGACLVVETLDHAKKRGARIYAEILGFSHNNEGHHMTSPRPGGLPTIRAMRDALAAAKKLPSQIDYINAHASATRINDENEAQCLSSVFREDLGRIPVSGTKPFTGHPLGATGAMETIICCLAIQHGWAPPNLHLEKPDGACAKLQLVPDGGTPGNFRTVLTNAFGFGGINSCLVLGKLE